MERISQEVLDSIGFIEIQPALDAEHETRRAMVDSLILNNDVLTLQLEGFQKNVEEKGWTKYEETHELVLDLSTVWKVRVLSEEAIPRVLLLLEDGTNYFLFNKRDMKTFNMNNTKKSDFVKAIIDGFKKMRELGYCNETGIYTVGVPRSITSPNGAFVFKTRFVTISRIIEGKTNAIKIYCCDVEKYFTIEANTQEQVEELVTWMLDKGIMPSLNSMRTLVIPAQSIKF